MNKKIREYDIISGDGVVVINEDIHKIYPDSHAAREIARALIGGSIMAGIRSPARRGASTKISPLEIKGSTNARNERKREQ